MPEWLVEHGIGEDRAALVEDGHILEARIELEDTVPAGTIIEAQLTSIGSSGRNGTARDANGTEYLLPHVPRDVTEGARLNVEVTRPPLPGPELWKRPLAKATRDDRRRPQSLAERLRACGNAVRVLPFPSPDGELARAGWNELMDEARSGAVLFPGGSLCLFATPAMTLIDVDGNLPLGDLAVAGARAAAKSIRRLDIGGSVGIDLPTVTGKEARQAAAEAVDATLPQPFERTAMNGFGFLQIVRPRHRASLLELAGDRAGFEARALLRRAAMEGSGARRLVGSPSVIAEIEARPGWIEAISRQSGGAIALRSDAALPIHGAYAEKV